MKARGGKTHFFCVCERENERGRHEGLSQQRGLTGPDKCVLSCGTSRRALLTNRDQCSGIRNRRGEEGQRPGGMTLR